MIFYTPPTYPAIDRSVNVYSEFSPGIATGSADSSAFGSSLWSLAGKWRAIIDMQLIEWGSAAQRGENPFEFPAPTLVSISTAINLIRSKPLPDEPRVVPDGNGGISFEWEKGEILHRLEIDDVGGIRETIFSGARLVHSHDVEPSRFK